jgi:hypothetical protein
LSSIKNVISAWQQSVHSSGFCVAQATANSLLTDTNISGKVNNIIAEMPGGRNHNLPHISNCLSQLSDTKLSPDLKQQNSNYIGAISKIFYLLALTCFGGNDKVDMQLYLTIKTRCQDKIPLGGVLEILDLMDIFNHFKIVEDILLYIYAVYIEGHTKETFILNLCQEPKIWTIIRKLVRFATGCLKQGIDNPKLESLVLGHIVPLCCAIIHAIDVKSSSTTAKICNSQSYQLQRTTVMQLSHLSLSKASSLGDDLKSMLVELEVYVDLEDNEISSLDIVESQKFNFPESTKNVMLIDEVDLLSEYVGNDSFEPVINNSLSKSSYEMLNLFNKASQKFQSFISTSSEIKKVRNICYLSELILCVFR